MAASEARAGLPRIQIPSHGQPDLQRFLRGAQKRGRARACGPDYGGAVR